MLSCLVLRRLTSKGVGPYLTVVRLARARQTRSWGDHIDSSAARRETCSVLARCNQSHPCARAQNVGRLASDQRDGRPHFTHEHCGAGPLGASATYRRASTDRACVWTLPTIKCMSLYIARLCSQVTWPQTPVVVRHLCTWALSPRCFKHRSSSAPLCGV
jgi:hypothetical protein